MVFSRAIGIFFVDLSLISTELEIRHQEFPVRYSPSPELLSMSAGARCRWGIGWLDTTLLFRYLPEYQRALLRGCKIGMGWTAAGRNNPTIVRFVSGPLMFALTLTLELSKRGNGEEGGVAMVALVLGLTTTNFFSINPHPHPEPTPNEQHQAVVTLSGRSRPCGRRSML